MGLSVNDSLIFFFQRNAAALCTQAFHTSIKLTNSAEIT